MKKWTEKISFVQLADNFHRAMDRTFPAMKSRSGGFVQDFTNGFLCDIARTNCAKILEAAHCLYDSRPIGQRISSSLMRLRNLSISSLYGSGVIIPDINIIQFLLRSAFLWRLRARHRWNQFCCGGRKPAGLYPLIAVP
jgi:hypothetical protein